MFDKNLYLEFISEQQSYDFEVKGKEYTLKTVLVLLGRKVQVKPGMATGRLHCIVCWKSISHLVALLILVKKFSPNSTIN